VLLTARAGRRRGELCGLRRSDVHLLADSRLLGCAMPRAHLHVVRRDNPNGAWTKSRRQRVVPLGILVVQVFDVYEFERFAVPRAGESDYFLVNLFREPIGAPMRPDAAIGRGREGSLRSLPPPVVAELLVGLQQRCRINAVKTIRLAADTPGIRLSTHPMAQASGGGDRCDGLAAEPDQVSPTGAPTAWLSAIRS